MVKILLIIAGAYIIYLRNSDAVLNQILYAEDGKWVGMGLTEGWLDTFINARKDYFVWGNLLLMWLSAKTSVIVSGNPLSLLPLCEAIYSYLFYSSVATLAFFVTRNYLAIHSRALLYLLILLIPLGDSSSEMFGRLSNIGYTFVFLNILLLVAREQSALSVLERMSTDTLLLLCIGTNPVCVAIVGLYLGNIWLQERKGGLQIWIAANAYLIIGFVVISAAIVMRFAAEGMFTSRGVSGPGQFAWHNMIEAITARAILYPFVFGFYGKLSNWASLTYFVFWIGLIVTALRNRGLPESRRLLKFSLAVLVVYVAATIFMRPYLTGELNHYTVTYTDRYYMGLNYIVVLVTVIVLDRLLSEGISKLVALGLLACIALVYVVNISSLFEGANPRTKLMTGLTLRDQLFSYSNNFSRQMTPDAEFSSGIGKIPMGEMVSGKEYSQQMLVDNDFVTGIAIQLATYARKNSGRIIIKVSSADGRYSFEKVVELNDVADCEYLLVDFDEVWEKQFGQYLKVSLTAPVSSAGNAITVLLTNNLLSKKHDASIQGKTVDGLSWSYKVLTHFSKERPLQASDIVHLPINPTASDWSMPVHFGDIGVSVEDIANSEHSIIASGKGTKPLGELVKGTSYSQVIPIPFRRLSGISLNLATYARKNTGHLDVEIKSNDGRYSLKKSIAMSEVGDCEYLKIPFDSDWIDMNGKEIEVLLSTREGRIGNAITVFLTKNRLSRKYDAQVNSVSIPAYSWDYRIFVD
jgi:hypothetical protein